MKIPKEDGTTAPKPDTCDNWKDILCDKCGKSCRDDEGRNFEYATITACWGYGSRKDFEEHEAHVCESCYDAFGIKPKIELYVL